jgi:hypothetical protein
MKTLGGRILIASGREDKHKEVTKRSLVNAGVPEDLLEGKHIVWYLRPTAGHTIESDIHLDFHNNKGHLVSSIASVPNNEVVAVIDNEFRNIIQFVNLVPADGLFYLQSTDATWSKPGMHRIFEALEADLGTGRMGYTPFSSFVPDEAIRKWMKQLSAVLLGGQTVPEVAVAGAAAALTVSPSPVLAPGKDIGAHQELKPDDLKDIRQWLTPTQVAMLADRDVRLTDGLADTLIYLSKLGAYLGVDLIDAALSQGLINPLFPPRS